MKNPRKRTKHTDRYTLKKNNPLGSLLHFYQTMDEFTCSFSPNSVLRDIRERNIKYRSRTRSAMVGRTGHVW